MGHAPADSNSNVLPVIRTLFSREPNALAFSLRQRMSHSGAPSKLTHTQALSNRLKITS